MHLAIFSGASFKVLLFLVVSPILVVFGFCWFVVKCFFNYLRDLNLKEAVAAVYTNSVQPQVGTLTLTEDVFSVTPLVDRHAA